MQAIMVHKKDGFFEIPSAAEPELFEDLKPEIEKINSIEALKGWEPWSHVINFTTFENETYDYLLSGNPLK